MFVEYGRLKVTDQCVDLVLEEISLQRKQGRCAFDATCPLVIPTVVGATHIDAHARSTDLLAPRTRRAPGRAAPPDGCRAAAALVACRDARCTC